MSLLTHNVHFCRGLVKGMAKAPNIEEDDLNIMFATNVTGLINITQVVLPVMLARGESGTGDIINIGSIAGREAYVGGSIYCATKAAIRAFTESLRKELIATRIRVIEVDPGQVETVSFSFTSLLRLSFLQVLYGSVNLTEVRVWQEFSVVRFYGDKSKADSVYA